MRKEGSKIKLKNIFSVENVTLKIPKSKGKHALPHEALWDLMENEFLMDPGLWRHHRIWSRKELVWAFLSCKASKKFQKPGKKINGILQGFWERKKSMNQKIKRIN